MGTPLGKSVALLAQDQNEEARNALEPLISDTEKYLANQYAWLAGLFIQQKDYKAAMKFANKSIDINPDDFNAFNIRGVCYAQAGDFQKAENDFQKSFNISPNFAAPFVNRGKILMNDGKYREAIRMFDEAIARFPNKADALLNKGQCHAFLKEYDFAKKACLDSLKVKETSGAYKSLGDLAYYQNNFLEAENMYSKAIELDESFFQAYFNRGKSREKLGKKSEAIQDFKATLKINPQYKLAIDAMTRESANSSNE